LNANGRTNEGVLERKHEWFSKEKTLEESPQGTKKWNFTTKISGLIFSYHGALPWWLSFKTRLHLYGAIREGVVCVLEIWPRSITKDAWSSLNFFWHGKSSFTKDNYKKHIHSMHIRQMSNVGSARKNGVFGAKEITNQMKCWLVSCIMLFCDLMQGCFDVLMQNIVYF
jgi:hypothetical protein